MVHLYKVAARAPQSGPELEVNRRTARRFPRKSPPIKCQEPNRGRRFSQDLCKQPETNTEPPSSWKPVPDHHPQPPPTYLFIEPFRWSGGEFQHGILFYLKIPNVHNLTSLTMDWGTVVCFDPLFLLKLMQSCKVKSKYRLFRKDMDICFIWSI